MYHIEITYADGNREHHEFSTHEERYGFMERTIFGKRNIRSYVTWNTI